VKTCIVCEAFPDHEGTHYSARDVNNRLFSTRIRSLGKSNSTVLPRCYSGAGLPLLASAQITDNPEAICVAGCWFCEQTPELFLEQPGGPEELESETLPPEVSAAEPPPLELPEAKPVEAEVAPEPIESPPEPPEAAEEPRKEVPLMASSNGSGKGYLAWSSGGLAVDVRTLTDQPGNGPRVEDLKIALDGFLPPDQVLVSITETLGRGDAWATLSVAPCAQADLLICTGQLIDRLLKAGVYEEVLLAHA